MFRRSASLLLFALFLVFGISIGQASPQSPQDALDIALGAVTQGTELKKTAGALGKLASKKLEEGYTQIKILHQETLTTVQSASTEQEKLQLHNSFLEAKKKMLNETLLSLDELLPQLRALSDQMYTVIGEIQASADYLKKETTTQASLTRIKNSGKKVDSAIKLAEAELTAIAPESIEYSIKSLEISNLKLERFRLIKSAERQLRQKQLCSAYIQDMKKSRDALVKIRNYTDDTKGILLSQRLDLLDNV